MPGIDDCTILPHSLINSTLSKRKKGRYVSGSSSIIEAPYDVDLTKDKEKKKMNWNRSWKLHITKLKYKQKKSYRFVTLAIIAGFIIVLDHNYRRIGSTSKSQKRIFPSLVHFHFQRDPDFTPRKHAVTSSKTISSDFEFYELNENGERQIYESFLEGKVYKRRFHTYPSSDDEDEDCKPPLWQNVQFGLMHCNAFHEIDIIKDSAQYLSHGHFRDVFGHLADDRFVMKVNRMKKQGFTPSNMDKTRLDALVMEGLSSSPSIADIYGYCAFSVMSEFLPQELEDLAIPGPAYMEQSRLNDKDEVKPQNNFTGTEKLHMALEMAEGVAAIHGFEGGVIVHNDIRLCQFLLNSEGRIKFNDFNRAVIMSYDEENRQYCKHNAGKGKGNHRSPEECKGRDLDEKIDVYSIANNIYSLLTGLDVYYEDEDDDVAQTMIRKGELPFIDPRYRTRSYAERMLVEIIERCWVYDADERADIFEVVEFLEEALAENLKLESEGKVI